MVTIDVWRSRIGAHHSRCCGWDSLCCSVNCDSLNWLATVILFVVLSTLLIIGNVESNPGPEAFQCSECAQKFFNLSSFSHHQKIHANSFNFQFSCGICLTAFSSFGSLNSHISKNHKAVRHMPRNEGPLPCPLKCNYCEERFASKKDLCHHYFEHLVSGIVIECPFREDCLRQDPFSSKSTFSKHLSQSHKGWRQDYCENSPERGGNGNHELTSGVVDYENDYVSDKEESFDEPYYDAETSFCHTEFDILKFIASFYVMLEVEYNVPVTVIDKVAETLALLSEMQALHMKSGMFEELKAQNLPEENFRCFAARLLDLNVLYLAHHKNVRGPYFGTNYSRMKHYHDYYPMVGLRDIPLNNDVVNEDSYPYAPLRETFSILFEDPSVRKEIADSFVRHGADNRNEYSDYFDGDVCRSRNHPDRRIDLILFQDAFSATSMLTTVQQKHKVLGVYMTIGNLRPWLRSQLKSIQLVMLILEAHVKKYRLTCFDRLIQDLKDLQQNGIVFEGETIPVFLQFVVGDNLGSHFLGGFMEGFTATYPCRYCSIKKQEIQRNPAQKGPTRTKQSYNRACYKISLKKLDSYQGIKENSPFNSIKDWHVCDPRLPPCLGHDLFHGVVNYDLTEILFKLVRLKWFTYSQLNKRIQQFKYTAQDLRNKPAPVKDKKGKKPKNLGGSAVQNWTLLRMLPFILEGKIKNPDHELWVLYLHLKEICENLCAPVFKNDQLDELQVKISSYLTERKTVLKLNTKPKHHYMLHYCDLIRNCGPLIYLWAMRFEHFHQWFKRTARAANNFINLPKTLSSRYQLLLSYQSQGSRYSDSISECKLHPFNSGSLSPEISMFIQSHYQQDNLQYTLSLEKNGITYKVGGWLVLKKSTNMTVGMIEAILVSGSSITVILRTKEARYMNEYGLYEISTASEGDLAARDVSTLQHPCPISTYIFNDEECFTLKYTPCSE